MKQCSLSKLQFKQDHYFSDLTLYSYSETATLPEAEIRSLLWLNQYPIHLIKTNYIIIFFAV